MYGGAGAHRRTGVPVAGQFPLGPQQAGLAICMPAGNWRRDMLLQFHTTLQRDPGVNRTKTAVRNLFWWPDLDADLEPSVKSCTACAKGKATHQKASGLLQPLRVTAVPWEESNIAFLVG